MQADLLIQDLSKKLGIESLKFDENQTCYFGVDDMLVNIKWQTKEDSLLIFMPLASGLNAYNPSLYEDLLSASLFGAETKAMHIGLHLLADSLILSKSLPIEALSLDYLVDYLSFFVIEGESWQAKISAYKLSEETEQS